MAVQVSDWFHLKIHKDGAYYLRSFLGNMIQFGVKEREELHKNGNNIGKYKRKTSFNFKKTSSQTYLSNFWLFSIH